jgi:hypothetical protein
MAQRANLIATYQNNPTLQGRYTQQEYLDLFDFSQAPATTTSATTTPATTTTPAATTGIQNIIGQNLNQGDGGDGPRGGGKFGNLDMSKPKEFNINGNIVTAYPNLKSGLYQDIDGLNVQNLGIGSFGVMGLVEKMLGLDSKEPKYPGLFDKVSYKALVKNPSLAKSFFDRQNVAKQKKLQDEINAYNKEQADIARAAKEKAAQQAALNAAYQTQTQTQREAGGGGGGQFDGAGSKQEYDRDPTGFSGSFQDGGRVYLYNRLK